MKISTVVGARPQFIKAATISRALATFPAIKESIIHTGQHFDTNMSDIFFSEMEIPTPSHFLGISGKSHGEMTGEMTIELEKIFKSEKPDIILLYGDTNSTLAGALAGSKLNIPIAHIEAGLRSFNMRMPEEINRILTDRVSKFLFCPTDQAITNLNSEGFNSFKDIFIYKTGDVMLDAALFYSKKSFDKKTLSNTLLEKDFLLATIHRQENTDDLCRLNEIFKALMEIRKTKEVILPLHPRTKKIIEKNNIPHDGITILDPVGYFDMLELLKNCKFVLTDSGGLQKEAYFFDKPCLTVRDETEWVELLDIGQNKIVGANYKNIINEFQKMSSTIANWKKGIYGSGNAAFEIINHLMEVK